MNDEDSQTEAKNRALGKTRPVVVPDRDAPATPRKPTNVPCAGACVLLAHLLHVALQ